MTRVVHVLAETTIGGAENQALYLLQALTGRGFDLELAFFRSGPQHDRFATLGLPMHQVEAHRRLPLDWRRRANVLRRVVGPRPPDILHTWLYETHLVGLVAGLAWPQTRIVLSHRSGSGVPGSRRHLLALRPLRCRIDHVVANSQAGAEVMLQFGLDPSRVSVIANGLPSERVVVERGREVMRRELGVRSDAPVVCAITRADATKDLPALFGAFGVVRARLPDAELVLVGPTARELRDFGARLPAGARTVGFQGRPADYMNAADAVVISSRTEGHSNVADEALMLGMPVAVTDTGAHASLVREAGGLVVPVGRRDLLGEALLELLIHPRERGAIRAIAEQRLSITQVADATAALYERLLSADRARRSPAMARPLGISRSSSDRNTLHPMRLGPSPQSTAAASATLPEWWCLEHCAAFESRDDHLMCPGGDHSVPCRDGIPRFVPSSTYADAFGEQWKIYRLTQLDSHTGTSISRDRLRRALGELLWACLPGARVLECGCGAGRFTEVLIGQGASVTSVDLSEAVDANAENCPPQERHRIAQASIAALPIRPGQFDIVLCLGVVQHTPSPEDTIAKLYEQVAPGGSVVIDHYTYSLARCTRVTAFLVRPWLLRQSPERRLPITARLVDRLLPLHRQAGPFARVLRRLSPITTYYHAYPDLPDNLRREWALLDTHDSLTAVYKHMRTSGQLRRALMRLGAEEVVCIRAGNGVEARARRPLTA